MTTNDNDDGTIMVPLVRIKARPEYRVRNTQEGTVNSYLAKMKAGRDMGVLKVAVRNSGEDLIKTAQQPRTALYLIDGFHRFTAMQQLGVQLVRVRPYDAKNLADARWSGWQENFEHGLPLKRSETRDMLKDYYAARQHMNADGMAKSLRDIGAELGLPYSSVRRWTLEDSKMTFNLYYKHGAHEDMSNTSGGLRKNIDERVSHAVYKAAISDAKTGWMETFEVLAGNPEWQAKFLEAAIKSVERMKETVERQAQVADLQGKHQQN